MDIGVGIEALMFEAANQFVEVPKKWTSTIPSVWLWTSVARLLNRKIAECCDGVERDMQAA